MDPLLISAALRWLTTTRSGTGAALVAGLAMGFAGGAWVGITHQEGAAQQQVADARIRATEAALLIERSAREQADLVMARLSTEQALNTRLTQERNDALTAATAGRTCLDRRALRVLDGAPGIRVTGLPASSAAGADAQGGPAAAPADPVDVDGPLVATDTDVGAWILGAGLAYESCRTRLNGLIDYLSTPAQPHPSRPDAKDIAP